MGMEGYKEWDQEKEKGAERCSFVQAFWLFVIGAFAGGYRGNHILQGHVRRADGAAAVHGWEKAMDEHFDDARMERIYPNAIRQ